MKLHYRHQGKEWIAHMESPLDIAIPLGELGPRAWYVEAPKIKPVMENGFVGSIALGGKVNFFNIQFNPHGNGTHTETLGHIDPDRFPISDWKGPFVSHALLITVQPSIVVGDGVEDRIILWSQLQQAVELYQPTALVIRTIPNSPEKLNQDYSNTHFPYLEAAVGVELNRLGIMHLLVDLPSVDREQDQGKLACHHAFWGFPETPRFSATITELIWVNDDIADGEYCLFLQPPRFENDAAPSRPILYPISEVVRDIE